MRNEKTSLAGEAAGTGEAITTERSIPQPSQNVNSAQALRSPTHLIDIRKGYARGWRFVHCDGGKFPKRKGWQSPPYDTLDDVLDYATRGNVGLLTGSTSGVVVIDVDTLKDSDGHPLETIEDSWRKARALDLPKTITSETGGNGLHLLFKQPAEKVTGREGAFEHYGHPKIDTRGEGNQVVFVGSVHPITGHTYHWAAGLSPDDVELADLPGHILEMLRHPRPDTPKPSDGAIDWDGTIGRRDNPSTNGRLSPAERCQRYLDELPDSVAHNGGDDALFQAACSCFRFGLSDADALEALRSYNTTKAQPPWPDSRLSYKLGQARAKVLADGEFGVMLHNDRDQSPAPKQAIVPAVVESTQTVADWEPCDVGRMLTEPAPAVNWLFDDMIAEGDVGILAAAGSVGKSWLTLEWCVSVASGKTMLPSFRVSRPRRVLLHASEDSEPGLWRRIRNIPGAYDSLDLLRENLTIYARVSEPLLIEKGGVVFPTRRLEWLKQKLTDGGYAILIIDPLSRWHALKENDAGHMTRMIEALEYLSGGTVTVIATHHVRKQSTDSTDSDAARGSGALRDGCRWVANMAHLPEKAMKGAGITTNRGYVTFDVSKSNNAPYLPKPIIFERCGGGYLRETDLGDNREAAIGSFIARWLAEHPGDDLNARNLERGGRKDPVVADLLESIKTQFTSRTTHAHVTAAVKAAIVSGDLVYKRTGKEQFICPPFSHTEAAEAPDATDCEPPSAVPQLECSTLDRGYGGTDSAA